MYNWIRGIFYQGEAMKNNQANNTLQNNQVNNTLQNNQANNTLQNNQAICENKFYDPIIEILEKERIRIQGEIIHLEKWLKTHERNVIKVRKKNNHYRYSIKLNDKEKYIPVSNNNYLRDNLTTTYAFHLLPQLKADFIAIEEMLKKYDPSKRSLIYSNMSAGRKAFVTPYYMSPEEKLAAFRAVKIPVFEYAGSSTPFRTRHGEMVRSKSELFIADELQQYEIPYHYEEEIILDGNVFHPDFIVMNPRTGQKYIWEHFGRMGDPKYVANALNKINFYCLCGFIPGKNLIATFEAEGTPLNPDVARKMIKEFLL